MTGLLSSMREGPIGPRGGVASSGGNPRSRHPRAWVAATSLRSPPGAERTTRAGEHGDAVLVVRVEGRERRHQRFGRGVVDGIADERSVEHDGGDRTVLVDENGG